MSVPLEEVVSMDILLTDTKKRYSELLTIAEDLSKITEKELLKSRKLPNIIWRYVITLALRKEGHTYNNIARVLNKHHSTIIHTCQYMDDMIRYNPSSAYAFVWKEFSTTISEPVLQKKYITTISKVDDWLTINNTPEELKQSLLESISSISI